MFNIYGDLKLRFMYVRRVRKDKKRTISNNIILPYKVD